MKKTLAVLIAVAAVLPEASLAEATLHVEADYSYYPSETKSEYRTTDPLKAEKAVSVGLASAYGFVDLASTAIKADVVTYPSINNTGASAELTLTDKFAFSSGFGQTAHLDWSVHGSFGVNCLYDPDTGACENYGYMGAGQYVVSVSAEGPLPLSNYAERWMIFSWGTPPPCTLSSPNIECYRGQELELRGTLDIPIFSATTYSVSESLFVFAAYGGYGNFGNTARMYLRVPEGVAYSSHSGVLFRDATQIIAVPEPRSSDLFLIGLLVFIAMSPMREAARHLVVGQGRAPKRVST